ncbi:MAG: hypothetical protein WA192_16880 [Candidatus Acidiferrales bacterium]
MKPRASFEASTFRKTERARQTPLREQIPLRDMSDCLLAVYDGVSRRAFQRYLDRGARAASDLEDWKAAEEEMFARISVDFEESAGNLYALASVPGCAAAEITVAVDERWLLIAGCGDAELRAEGDEAGAPDDSDEDEGRDFSAGEAARILSAPDRDAFAARRDARDQSANVPPRCGDNYAAHPGVPRFPPRRPFCVVALRAEVDPGRSVAVLSNGLLAIRMSKAALQTPLPSVA